MLGSGPQAASFHGESRLLQKNVHALCIYIAEFISARSSTGAYLQSREFEEVFLVRYLQQVLLDVPVDLADKTCVAHAAGKVAIGDGTLAVHL